VTANPDLPILDELGEEFARLIDTELGRVASRERARPAQRPSRTRTRRGHRHRRVARRSAIVLVLLCLIGGVAVAARLGGDGKPADTSPTTLGRDPTLGWRLSGYRDRGRLCLLFGAGGELTSACGPALGASGLRTTSLVAGDRRFVAGLTGAQAGAVAVNVDGARRVEGTRRATDPEAAGEAGVPAGAHWFVVSFAKPTRAPARVVTLDDRGRRLGPVRVDCSLGVVGPACIRQIRARAEDAPG
jgi:hypothetical protein